MQVGEWIKIVVHKYDQRQHYAWNTVVRGQCDQLTVVGRPGPRDLYHYSKDATFTFQTDATEFFWQQLPFSVGVSWSDQRQELRWYCNIHEPLWYEDDGIHFIDLDIDVVKHGNQPFHLVDEDEFISHAAHYGYPNHYHHQVPAVSKQVVAWLNTWPLGSPAELIALCQQWADHTPLATERLEQWLLAGHNCGIELNR